MDHFRRTALLAALVIFAGALCLPADDQPQCPLCGNKDVKFEDSPVGAFRKLQFAVITKSEKLLRECMVIDQSNDIQAIMRNGWEILATEVKGSKVDGDHGEIEIQQSAQHTITLKAVREGGLWKLDMRLDRTAPDEVSAQACLKQFVSTEGVWRQTDSDGNGVQDYWTRDVAGFYGVTDAGHSTLKYIDLALARADKEGAAHYPVVGKAAPKAGYWFRVMKTDERGKPYQQQLGTSEGAYNNSAKYGFCAYPAEYGKTGVRTFIVNETGVIYCKDLGPDAKDGVDTWPDDDPTTKGWDASD